MEDPLEQLKATLRKPLDTVEARSALKDQLRRIVKRALRTGNSGSSVARWIRAKAMEIVIGDKEVNDEELALIVEEVVAKIADELGGGTNAGRD